MVLSDVSGMSYKQLVADGSSNPLTQVLGTTSAIAGVKISPMTIGLFELNYLAFVR